MCVCVFVCQRALILLYMRVCTQIACSRPICKYSLNVCVSACAHTAIYIHVSSVAAAARVQQTIARLHAFILPYTRVCSYWYMCAYTHSLILVYVSALADAARVQQLAAHAKSQRGAPRRPARAHGTIIFFIFFK